MDGEEWCGFAVCTRDGTALGVVVGVFAQGPLVGRLRVHGDYRRWTSWTGTAVYAIPRHALVHGKQHSLVLNATPGQARGAWLMHVLRSTAPSLNGISGFARPL
ncbi:MAG TPA: hypothetical protein VKF37_14550 [Chloroflexota bacterium]|nr:hypothetical protein [Chloroflexota bacterium]